MSLREDPTLHLPVLSADLAGISGTWKEKPEDFLVKELPLYEPSGEGEHIYLLLRRKGQNTHYLVRELSRLLGIPERGIGTAGLKDRQAVAIQTFSVHLPKAEPQKIAKEVETALEVECMRALRHGNKLRTGHLSGNYFEIIIKNTQAGDLERGRNKLEFIEKHGLPNYYGVQRFGRFFDNHLQGKELLQQGRGGGKAQNSLHSGRKGRRRKGHKSQQTRLLLSAYQSYLFNEIVARRIRENFFGTLLVGDLAKKEDSGGLFLVEDAAIEGKRFFDRRIDWTGPIFGKKMKFPLELPALWERELLEKEGVSLEDFARAGLEGTRRAGRVFPKGAKLEPHKAGLLLSFSLPAGSYASMLLREFGIF